MNPPVPSAVASRVMTSEPDATTRRLRIEWRPGRKITALLRMPIGGAATGILLAHGAGAGQRHPFMVGLRNRLATAGYPTMTFDYPYMEAGRRAPDRAEILLESHRAAVCRLRSYVDHVVLAGKSMGGRMASHLAAGGERCSRMVLYGYPLVPLGKEEPRPTDHLRDVEAPLLFITGSRDRLAPLELLGPIVGGLDAATLHVVADADHTFRVPKRSGLDDERVLDLLAAVTTDWLGPRRAAPAG